MFVVILSGVIQVTTPIQPILGLADILRSKQVDGRQQADYLDVILEMQKDSKDLLKIF